MIIPIYRPSTLSIYRYKSKQYIINIFIIMFVENERTKCLVLVIKYTVIHIL
jgi:hypothetical protein